METINKKRKIGQRGDQLFQVALLAWPLLQFAVFYVLVNLNSFKLAFEGINGGFSLEHFEFVFSAQMFPEVMDAVKTSLLFYLISTGVSVPLGLLFAFYIYKKAWGGKMFRFFLFLPSILSSMVMVILFHTFMSTALGDLLHNWFGMATDTKQMMNMTKASSYTPVLFFHIWISFGTTTLVYSNKMGELSPETVEAAQLDGVSNLQEFWYIVLPFAFPTISVFLVTGLATIFANQYNLFSFYKSQIGFDAGSLGYYLFNLVQDPTASGNWDSVVFHRASALSLLITSVVIPVAMTARWALDKFGPQE